MLRCLKPLKTNVSQETTVKEEAEETKADAVLDACLLVASSTRSRSGMGRGPSPHQTNDVFRDLDLFSVRQRHFHIELLWQEVCFVPVSLKGPSTVHSSRAARIAEPECEPQQ